VTTGIALLLVALGWLITAAMMNVRAAATLVIFAWLLAAALVGMPNAKADDGPDPSMICQQLVLGFTPDQIVAQLHSGDPRFNTYTAPRTVWDAIIQQCP
jgi:hypothetical protein